MLVLCSVIFFMFEHAEIFFTKQIIPTKFIILMQENTFGIIGASFFIVVIMAINCCILMFNHLPNDPNLNSSLHKRYILLIDLSVFINANIFYNKQVIFYLHTCLPSKNSFQLCPPPLLVVTPQLSRLSTSPANTALTQSNTKLT